MNRSVADMIELTMTDHTMTAAEYMNSRADGRLLLGDHCVARQRRDRRWDIFRPDGDDWTCVKPSVDDNDVAEALAAADWRES